MKEGLKMENEICSIDYGKECEVLKYKLQEKTRECEEYRQALLNICLKI